MDDGRRQEQKRNSTKGDEILISFRQNICIMYRLLILGIAMDINGWHWHKERLISSAGRNIEWEWDCE